MDEPETGAGRQAYVAVVLTILGMCVLTMLVGLGLGHIVFESAKRAHDAAAPVTSSVAPVASDAR